MDKFTTPTDARAGLYGRKGERPSTARQDEPLDVDAIVQENAQLRELVIQLSKLVLKGVLDPKKGH
jgi:hypothetical protein